MLAALEQQVTAQVQKALTDARLRVSDSVPVEGQGSVSVTLLEVGAGDGFDREQHAVVPAGKRRVLPVSFAVRVGIRVRPAEESAQALRAARELLLGGVSLVAHALGERKVRSGAAFLLPETDLGFDVTSFTLEKADVGSASQDGLLAGELLYRGTAGIWPLQDTEPVFFIRETEVTVVAAPQHAADPPRVAVGKTSTIDLRSLVQLSDKPLRVAVRVMSDLPPAERGTIVGGREGTPDLGGERFFDSVDDAFTVTYAAAKQPATEIITIHYLHDDDRRGALIGSAAITVVPGAAS